VIVDTSNEIGGDGEIPHAGIGRARRMQVPCVDMQHKVSILGINKSKRVHKDIRKCFNLIKKDIGTSIFTQLSFL
jgi:stage III sporulation protein SpoIIIAA